MIREIHARSTWTGRHFFRAIIVLWVFAGPGYAQVEMKAMTRAELQAIKESYQKGDYVKVVRDLTPLAERGDMEAQYQLALMYANGRGVPRDQRQAATWFEKATAVLDPGAQFNLGIMYFEGQGVPRDYEQAARWFKGAGERGDAEALFNLGLMYDDGKGVRRDVREAVLWYKRAAELGLKQAQLMLAGMYRDGAGVSKDETLAYLWYAMAAEQDDKDAAAERDRLAKRLTPAQYKEAIRMLHELQVQGHVRGG
ncbi:MAG: tetratricopeptide repeat protein [Gammaproteobacteria bacterium]